MIGGTRVASRGRLIVHSNNNRNCVTRPTPRAAAVRAEEETKMQSQALKIIRREDRRERGGKFNLSFIPLPLQ